MVLVLNHLFNKGIGLILFKVTSHYNAPKFYTDNTMNIADRGKKVGK